MKNLKFISIVIILLITVSIKVSGEEEKKILILNSYHHGMTWTDNIEKGIKNELNESLQVAATLHIFTNKMYIKINPAVTE